MFRKKTNLSMSSYFVIGFLLTFAVASVLVISVVSREMRRESLQDAREKTSLLLERNLATHHYFSQELKPKLFERVAENESEDYFEPAWMSSTYAIRQIDKYFIALHEYGDYYYKECAVNARSPENEADDYERAFIEELNRDPKVTIRSEIRNIEGEAYFVTLRRGEMMEESCLRCHSTPDNAPGDMVTQYGSERSFNRSAGDVVSAISIRVPLAKAYATMRATTIKLSVMLMLILGLTFSSLYFFTKRVVLLPLKTIEEKSIEISFDPQHLGDQIPIPYGKELSEVASAFNNMSVKLRDGREHLEDDVKKRTNALQRAQEIGKIGSWELDIAKNVLIWTEETYRLFGVPLGTPLTYEIFLECVHPDDREYVDREWMAALEGKPYDIEHRIIVDGKVIWVREKAEFDYDGDGKYLRGMGFTQDITGPKQVKEELKYESALRNLLLDNLPCIAMVIKIGTREIVASNKMAREIGAIPGEFCYEKCSQRDTPCTWCLAEEFWAGKEEKEVEIEYRGSHYHGRWVPLNDELYVHYITDITGRKEDEAALQEALEFSENIIADLPVGLAIYDAASGQCLVANGTMASLVGTTEDQMLAQNFYEIESWKSSSLLEAAQKSIRDNSQIQTEVTVTTTFGKDMSADCHFAPFRAGGRELLMLTLADVTERKQAEAYLRESEERFRMIYENAPVLIDAFDENGRCVLWNKECCRVFGWTLDEINAQDDALLLFYPDPVVRNEVMQTIISSPDGKFREWHPTTKDGKTRITLWANFRLPDGMVFSLGYDITERREAEESLRRERENLTNILDGMEDGVYLVNQGHDILYINPALEKVFGAVEGRKCYQYFHDRQKVCPWCKNSDVLSGKTVHWEWTSDKNGRTYDLVDSPLTLQDGSIGKLEIFRDITERKRSQEKLREYKDNLELQVETRTVELNETNLQLREEIVERKRAEEALQKMAMFAEFNPAPVLRIDPEGSILSLNVAARTIIGDDAKVGISLYSVMPCFESLPLAECIAGGDVLIKECEIGGRFYQFVVRGIPDLGVGQIYGSDITKRKKLEEKQRSQLAQLAHVSRLTTAGELASSLAHELNQPLCAIATLSEGCKRLIASDNAQLDNITDGVEEISTQAERAGQIIRRMSQFVKKHAPESSKVKINSIVNESVELIRVQARKFNVKVKAECDGDFTVQADSVQVQQVLVNLMQNGIDAMQDIEIARRDLFISVSNTNERFVEIAVKDNGSGISAKVGERIFEPFYTTKEDGIGIGLAISRSIVEAHGGRLWAEKRGEGGTVMRFTLPKEV